MFVKGSRYRNLPVGQRLDASGERSVSVDLRFIERVEGQFLHTVAERERLDLLAFKYYTDSERWWLIADANPEFSFPPDILDTRPILAEEFALTRLSFVEHSRNLLLILETLGDIGPLAPADGVYFPATDFFSTSVLVRYAAGARPLILEAIRRAGFRLLESVAFPDPAGTAEQFTWEDPAARLAWNELLGALSMLPGVHAAESVAAGETLRIVYNTAQTGRATFLGYFERRGFQLVPQRTRAFDRIGAQIVIPPNQA